MNQIVNYTRLTTSDRLSDRFATCQVYEPADSEKAKRGKLFLHIEIMGQWLANSQIGQTVINTLIREYYKDGTPNGLVGFESAIKKVNETLAGIAQGGETDWIGKFSGVLVLIQDTDIHFAQTGTSHSYLYRFDKVNFVTENKDAESSPHPLKTFTNITSGTLELSDKIVIANKTFFDNVKPSELKLMISSESPTLTVIECAKILKSRSTRTASAIIAELTTKNDLADIPINEKIETIYIDHSYVTIFGKMKKTVKRVGVGLSLASSKLSQRLKTTTNKTLKKVSEHAVKNKSKVEQISKSETGANQLFKSVNLAQLDRAVDSSRAKNETQKVNRNLIKLKNKLKRLLIRARLYPKNKQRRAAFGLAIVISILAITIAYSSYKNFQSNRLAGEARQTGEIQNLINEATEQIASANKDEATILYEKIQSYDLSNLDKSATRQISDEINDLKQKYFTLEGISIIKPQKSFETNSPLITGSPNGFYILENLAKLSFLDADTLQIKKQSEFSNIGDVKQIFYLDEIATIGFSSGNKIFVSDPIKPSLTESNISTGSSVIKTFGTNIYLKNSEASQILKSGFTDGEFLDPKEYLLEPQPNKIEDFSIDGSVYTINSDNKIRRFSRGKEVAVIEPAIQSITWTTIETSADSTNIFLAGKDKYGYRIAKIKKNGDVAGQFEIENITIKNLVFLPQRNLVVSIDEDNIEVYSI